MNALKQAYPGKKQAFVEILDGDKVAKYTMLLPESERLPVGASLAVTADDFHAGGVVYKQYHRHGRYYVKAKRPEPAQAIDECITIVELN